MSTSNSREAVLSAAKLTAMAHGYSGLNFRDIASAAGLKAPSVYHHFPTKADLGAAVAKRYWEDIQKDLNEISRRAVDAQEALRLYPGIFRTSLANENRLCLVSFMAAESDDLPEQVKVEVRAFADVNVTWLNDQLAAAGLSDRGERMKRARAIYAAVMGAQLLSRSRSDILLFDSLIDAYRDSGLLSVKSKRGVQKS